MSKDRALIEAINFVQTKYLTSRNFKLFFQCLLQEFIKVSESEYGYLIECIDTTHASKDLIPPSILGMHWNQSFHKIHKNSIDNQLKSSPLNELVKQIIDSKKPVTLDRIKHDPSQSKEKIDCPIPNDLLGIPLITRSNKLIGLLILANRPQGYSKKIIEFLLPMVMSCANIMANLQCHHQHDLLLHDLKVMQQELETRNSEQKKLTKILEEKTKLLLKARNELTRLTSYDPLTGLQNRTLFQWTLSQAIQSANHHHSEFALLLIDIDNFKWINDNFGHDAGDAILKKLASILKEIIHQDDDLARIGSDEFAITLNHIENYGTAISLAHQLLNAFETPIRIDNKIIHLSISIGATIYPLPKQKLNEMELEKSNPVNLLLKQTDIALYRAKKIGKGTLALFSLKDHVSYAMINEIESALQDAIDKTEFTLLYQPIINIENLEIIGAEALLRWNNPTLGKINPIDFIPIAERNGYIHKIGIWVFNEVCKQASIWKKQGLKNLFIAVNVSPIQLRKSHFTHQMAQITKKYDIDPSQIEIEITESSMKASDNFFSPKFLNFIKDSQIKLSIDDFGTGYSTLSRLAELPVSTLKIDGSFIKHMQHDPKNFNIVKSAIALAQSLSIKAIAECVETKEQAEALLKLNCQLAQGYYYYKPMPVDAMTSLFFE